MNYDDVKQYIKELNVTSLKVTDTNGKKLVEFIQAPSPESLINKLDAFLPSLKAQGRVVMLGANESQYKQNWKECCHWNVTFGTDIVQVNNSTPAHLPSGMGYMSRTEAELLARNKELENEIKWNTRLSELEKKIEKANEKPKEHIYERLADKYGPIALAAMGFKFEPEQMNTMAQMYQLQGLQNGTVQPHRNTGIAGPNEQGAVIQRTPEEEKMIKDIVASMEQLSTKIPDQKILTLLEGLNANPALADMAINFMNNQKK
jgi:nitrate reductase NapAB chaperone NapD